jgi:SAM-dependent methyltransferase
MQTETLSQCILCGSPAISPIDKEFGFFHCKCGFIFDNPRPTLAAIAEHYSKDDQYDGWIKDIEPREKLWQRRLSKFLPDAAKGSLLDVGAGIGQFLNIAKPYFTQVAGTELSESACQIAKETYGLDLKLGTIDSLDLPSFDNITLVHVLEHVPSPKETLARCYDLLNPGGRLLICVPNDIKGWDSRLRAFKSRRRPNGCSPLLGLPRCGESPEIHLSHFTRETLTRGVIDAGFKVRRVHIDPYYVRYGWKLLAHHALFAIHDILRLPTYQTLWVVAEK